MRLLLLLVVAAAAKPNPQGSRAASKKSEFIKLVMEGPPDKCVSDSCGAHQLCQVRQCRCEVCIPKTCDDLICEPDELCEHTANGPVCRPKNCNELTCGRNEICEDTEYGGKCRPKTCDDLVCLPNELCKAEDGVPSCRPISCADIRCSAGEKCDDLPDGPDCVPDVPTCEGFFCRRGTNCHIRVGSPTCLPNTCLVRECEPGLNCIDTPVGALCRKGQLRGTCDGKYCPPNSKCELAAAGPTCAHI